MAPSIVRHGNITWRVNEQSQRVGQHNASMRALVDSQNRLQLKAERDAITSRIHKLSPRAKKVFLAARLQHIKSISLINDEGDEDSRLGRADGKYAEESDLERYR